MSFHSLEPAAIWSSSVAKATIDFLLACTLGGLSWAYFSIYLAVGVLVYFAYGMWHSRLNQSNPTEPVPNQAVNISADNTDDSTFDVPNDLS